MSFNGYDITHPVAAHAESIPPTMVVHPSLIIYLAISYHMNVTRNQRGGKKMNLCI